MEDSGLKTSGIVIWVSAGILRILLVLYGFFNRLMGDPVQTTVNGIFNKNFNICYQEVLSRSNMCRLQLPTSIFVENYPDGSLRKSRLLK